MVCLIGLLGIRAYLVADSHSTDLRELSDRDMRAQTLLDRIEIAASSHREAARKFAITRDPAYQRLAVHEHIGLRRLTDSLKELLAVAHPKLVPATNVLSDRRQIQGLRDALDGKRKLRLQRAEHEAAGLLRLILFALLLSIGIAAWLIYFFYDGLMVPLRALSDATSRIRAGELSFRIPRRRGVTELRELCQSFNAMAERLENLEVAKAEFLATVSHEFKNPLAALKEGLALLANKESSLSQAGRDKTFAACVIASKRLESMMNNLLMHARAENGLFRFDITPKDLRPAIDLAIQEAGPLAAKRGMSIRFEPAGELHAAFNFDGIVHALENLIINAVKYGSDKSLIDVHARPLEQALERAAGPPLPFVEISISNSGKPIAPGELAQVFDRFYRGPGATDPQGLGLGLHVVKKIVEAHHGTVTAQSTGGRTIMTIRIPSAYESAPREERDRPQRPVPVLRAPGILPSPTALAALALGFSMLGSCANLPTAPERPEPPRPPAIAISRGTSLDSLERELAGVSSRWVSVPTGSLRSLLHSAKNNRNECKALSGKLEAIKNIDLETNAGGGGG